MFEVLVGNNYRKILHKLNGMSARGQGRGEESEKARVPGKINPYKKKEKGRGFQSPWHYRGFPSYNLEGKVGIRKIV